VSASLIVGLDTSVCLVTRSANDESRLSQSWLFFVQPTKIVGLTDVCVWAAIGRSHPEFMTRCDQDEAQRPIDVTSVAVRDFVHALYREITNLFDDEWIHTGGDEGTNHCQEELQCMIRLHLFHGRLPPLQYRSIVG
jgi:Glycosyl hydrolase family 20, catalytic domain